MVIWDSGGYDFTRVHMEGVRLCCSPIHVMNKPRIQTMNEALEILRDMGLMWQSRWLTREVNGREERVYGGIEFKQLKPDFDKLRDVQEFYDYNEIRFNVHRHFEERLKFTKGQ